MLGVNFFIASAPVVLLGKNLKNSYRLSERANCDYNFCFE